MAYTVENFKSKKALKEAIKSGRRVPIQNEFIGQTPTEGTVTLEGPHYPKAHTWCGAAILKNGSVVSVS